MRGGVRENVVKIAVSQIGTKEEYTNGGKQVNTYLKTVGLGSGFYWCAAFYRWCLLQAGLKPTHKANGAARSWFQLGKNISLDLARPGDAVGFYYANLGRIGHIALLERLEGRTGLITIEGNTSEAGSRNGDGVYRKRRMRRSVYAAANWID